jgi:hypothetical protein
MRIGAMTLLVLVAVPLVLWLSCSIRMFVYVNRRFQDRIEYPDGVAGGYPRLLFFFRWLLFCLFASAGVIFNALGLLITVFWSRIRGRSLPARKSERREYYRQPDLREGEKGRRRRAQTWT